VHRIFSVCYCYNNYAKDKPKLTRKSDNAVNADHVLKFIYDAACSHMLAVVQAPMINASDTVNVCMAETIEVCFICCFV
jgi:hypothetical protein